MNISRTIAIALIGLSIGLSATSANAGFLGDVVGKVANKVTGEVKQSAKPQNTGGLGSMGMDKSMGAYLSCLNFNSKGNLNNLSSDNKARVIAHCKEYARS